MKNKNPVPAKNFTRNIIKGIITSIIGVITMILTLFLVFTSTIDFIWSGIAGLSIGTILLLAPDTIVQKLGDVIKAVGMNRSGAASNDADIQQIKDEEKIDNPDKQ